MEEEGPAVTCAEDLQQPIKHVTVQLLACRSSAPEAPAARPRLHASEKRRAHTTLLVGKQVDGSRNNQHHRWAFQTEIGRLTVTRAEAGLPHKDAAKPPLAQAPAAQATSRCQHVHLTVPATSATQ